MSPCSCLIAPRRNAPCQGECSSNTGEMGLWLDAEKGFHTCGIAVSVVIGCVWLRSVCSFFLAILLPAVAQPATDNADIPNGTFYVGFGANYNAINFGTQNIYAVGTSDNYEHGSQVSSGTAAGPGTVSMPFQSTGTASVQLGYFQHFSDSDWLWGAKFSYSDLRASSTTEGVDVPQAGAFNSYQTSITSQLSLIPFIGRSFGRGFVYAGAGATLSETQTHLNGLVGYAVINGVNTNVSGAPQNFSSSGWVLGGAATVGGTYFLSSSWFLDLDYVFSKTAAQRGNYSSTFVNSTTTPGVTTVGTLVGDSSENIVTQSVTITINKAF